MFTRPSSWTRRLAQEIYNTCFEITGTLAGCRLYHEPNHIPMPWQGPILTTVHDLSVLRHPEWHPADRVDWYQRDFHTGIGRTTHFISVSEFTRGEMIDCLGLDPARITVIPNGVRAIFHPRPADQVASWLRTAGLPTEYILYVGTIEPRKNLPGLIEAYACLPAPASRFALVIAGMSGWAKESLRTLAARHGISDRVHVTGYVSDEDLAWLYNGARLLAWPSFYEGFGLPPLEAMASGTPVVTSNCAAMPEYVGDAGLLVDPEDVAGLSAAMRELIEDDALHADLSRRGRERARPLTWQRCAAEHARLYRQFEEA